MFLDSIKHRTILLLIAFHLYNDAKHLGKSQDPFQDLEMLIAIFANCQVYIERCVTTNQLPSVSLEIVLPKSRNAVIIQEQS